MALAKISLSRFAVVASTGGSVVRAALEVRSFRKNLALIVVDRECGAEQIAADFGVALIKIEEKNALTFSDKLLAVLRQEKIDAMFSFYLRLYRGELLKEFENRIVNLHPSLLPSFKGLRVFEAARAAAVPFLGSTVHFIDDSMDDGPIIAQGVVAASPLEEESVLRHCIFVQQVKQLVQTASWLREGRITVDSGRVIVADAQFEESDIVPNLDDQDALGIDIPSPF